MLTLEAFWAFCKSGGSTIVRPSFSWFKLREPYLGLHRHFHNWGHIERGWDRLHIPEVKAYTYNQLGVLGGWLVHDVIYDPHRNDNERESAHWAHPFFQNLGMDTVAYYCSGFVMATSHCHLPNGDDYKLIADNDLFELAVDWKQFHLNTVAIRREYSFVPDSHFAAERKKVLKGFYERKEIFRTRYFRQFEDQAKENLARSISELDAFLRHSGSATFNGD